MKISEIADYLRVSIGSIKRRKDIPCKRVGKRKDREYDLKEVMNYLKKFDVIQ